VEGGPPLTPDERRAILTRARDQFNAGEYWLAHESLRIGAGHGGTGGKDGKGGKG